MFLRSLDVHRQNSVGGASVPVCDACGGVERHAGTNSGSLENSSRLPGNRRPAGQSRSLRTSDCNLVNGVAYLVDLGPGVVRRANAAAIAKRIEALEPTRLRVAFVTHLHSDHTVGYPDLIFTPWSLGRREPIDVYGPRGIKSMTEHLIEAYQSISRREEIRMESSTTTRAVTKLTPTRSRQASSIGTPM